jgi:hypothetical protein
MNLQDFIATALTEIVAGVSAAAKEAEVHGALIGSMPLYGYLKEAKIVTTEGDRSVSQVEFDVVLAESSGTSTKGGIGVFLGSIALGSQGASQGEATSHSRVKFSVPIAFPNATLPPRSP